MGGSEHLLEVKDQPSGERRSGQKPGQCSVGRQRPGARVGEGRGRRPRRKGGASVCSGDNRVGPAADHMSHVSPLATRREAWLLPCPWQLFSSSHQATPEGRGCCVNNGVLKGPRVPRKRADPCEGAKTQARMGGPVGRISRRLRSVSPSTMWRKAWKSERGLQQLPTEGEGARESEDSLWERPASPSWRLARGVSQPRGARAERGGFPLLMPPTLTPAVALLGREGAVGRLGTLGPRGGTSSRSSLERGGAMALKSPCTLDVRDQALARPPPGRGCPRNSAPEAGERPRQRGGLAAAWGPRDTEGRWLPLPDLSPGCHREVLGSGGRPRQVGAPGGRLSGRTTGPGQAHAAGRVRL